MRRASDPIDDAGLPKRRDSGDRNWHLGSYGKLDGRWLILAVLVFARTNVGFQFQSVAALGPVLIEEMGIDFALLGAIIGLFMLPGVVLALPGGILGQRFGDKRIVLIGLTLMTLGGVALAVSPTPSLFIVGRIISGIGAVLLNVLVAKMVADWFAARDTAVAMSFYLTSWPIGLGLALVLLAPLGEVAGSSAAMALTAAFSAVGLGLIFAFYRPPADEEHTEGTFRITLTMREWVLILLAGLIWAFFNLGFVLILAFGPSFLTDGGYSLAQAGMLSSISMWVCAPALILGGYAAQRLNGNALAITFLFLGAVAGAALTTGVLPILWFVLLGLAIGFPAGPLMKLPVMVLSAKNRALGMGAFFACFYAGMAVLPPIAGWLRDITASSAAPLWFASATMLASILFLLVFLIVESRWKVDA